MTVSHAPPFTTGPQPPGPVTVPDQPRASTSAGSMGPGNTGRSPSRSPGVLSASARAAEGDGDDVGDSARRGRYPSMCLLLAVYVSGRCYVWVPARGRTSSAGSSHRTRSSWHPRRVTSGPLESSQSSWSIRAPPLTARSESPGPAGTTAPGCRCVSSAVIRARRAWGAGGLGHKQRGDVEAAVGVVPGCGLAVLGLGSADLETCWTDRVEVARIESESSEQHFSVAARLA